MLPLGGNRFRSAHELIGTFENVHADVDHGTAALKLLLTENTPVRNAAAAESLASDEHDVAELPVFARLNQGCRIGVVTLLESDGKFDFALFRRRDHFFAFGGIHRHRFFDHGMASGKAGVHDRRAVDTVRCADVYGIGFDFFEHFLPVLEESLLRNAPFLLHDFESFRIDIHTGNDLNLRNFFVRRQVSLGDSTAADNCHSEFFALEFLRRTIHLDRYAFSHFAKISHFFVIFPDVSTVTKSI